MTLDQENSLISLGVDLSTVMERFVDNESLYFRCCKKFLEDKSYENFMDSLKAGNPEVTFDYVHALKGVSANLGFENLYNPVSEIVEVFRAGSMDYDEVTLEMIKVEYQIVCNTLNKIL